VSVLDPIAKDEEIAHLKDLLAFAVRPDLPSSTVRFEISFGKEIRLCVTAPGADEAKIARIAIRHIEAVFALQRAGKISDLVATMLLPILSAANACIDAEHLVAKTPDGKRASAYCAACLSSPLRAAAAFINNSAEDEPGAAPVPEVENES